MKHNLNTMYNYSTHTTESLLNEKNATESAVKLNSSRDKFWRNGQLATIHHIEDELTRRGVKFTPWNV